MSIKYFIEWSGKKANRELYRAGYVYDNPDDCIRQIDRLYEDDALMGCYQDGLYQMWVEEWDDERQMDDPVYDINPSENMNTSKRNQSIQESNVEE